MTTQAKHTPGPMGDILRLCLPAFWELRRQADIARSRTGASEPCLSDACTVAVLAEERLVAEVDKATAERAALLEALKSLLEIVNTMPDLSPSEKQRAVKASAAIALSRRSVSGRLLQFFGVWKVQSGYGTFPLSRALQTKPDISSNGAWVFATVFRGDVTDYHFSSQSL